MKKSTATLCSLALCLWGYQTGVWQFAIPMVVALEARAAVKQRWTFPGEYFQVIHVLAAFLWLLAIFYIPPNSPSPIPYAASYHLLKCLPVGLFALILAQTYCINFTSFYRVLFRPVYGSNQTINLYYPYLGICLLAASVTGGNTILFLILTAGLMAGFLGSLRSQRFSPKTFYGLIALALTISFIGTNQFYWLQANVKLKSPDLFSNLIQNIASFASKNTNQPSKDIFNPDALKKVVPRAEKMTISAAKSVTQSTQSTKTAALPQSNGSSQSVTQSNGPVGSSQGTGLPQSKRGFSQSVTQSTETAGSSQGTEVPQSSQSIAQPIEGTGSAQNISQRSGDDISIHTPKILQDINQNPDGTTNPKSLSGIVQRAEGNVDPQKSSTQIGNSGALRLSDEILFRVSPNLDQGANRPLPTFPLYVREASYDQYNAGTWKAAKSRFIWQISSSNTNKGHWLLAPYTTSNTTSVRISANLQQPEGVLKLPTGTTQINDLTVDELQYNTYGTVLIKGKPGAITYTAQFDETLSLDSSPINSEKEIPPAEKPAMQKILRSLDIKEKSDQEIVNAISAFFRKDFKYSLELPKPQKNTTPLATFLLDRRSGHCEYFASATSLLLRSAGIPTRYVVGYYVHEYSPLERSYIVRAQDAHAWVMAYVNGSWVKVDTTPASGVRQNGNDVKTSINSTSQNRKISTKTFHDKNVRTIRSLLQKTSDTWSTFSSRLTKRLDPTLWPVAIIVLGLAMMLFSIFFVWIMIRRNRSRRLKCTKRSVSQRSSESVADGLDSEFYLIEKRLGQWGLERKSSETVRQWILRLKQQLPKSQMNNLNQIIDLHYCYRFDPQGIVQEDRAKLRSMIQFWLIETNK